MEKEYGGYIELESFNGNEYHSNAIALNCGRNCLYQLIISRKIQKIFLPYFCCGSVLQPCKKLNIQIEYYHIGPNLKPIFSKTLSQNEWLYIVNLYGQLTNSEISMFKQQFINIIVDNAHAFFQYPVIGVDTLYTCRKFFGVADGAYLYANVRDEFEKDFSYNRMHFLLGRYEKGAREFYKEYIKNNRMFADEPIKSMSKLTHNLLKGIDYEKVRRVRTENFKHLHGVFSNINKLRLMIPEGAFMYPLYIKQGDVFRKKLQAKNIYIPTLWPDVFNLCTKNDIEYDMANNILPLPVDQRYIKEDIDYIIEEVQKCLN